MIGPDILHWHELQATCLPLIEQTLEGWLVPTQEPHGPLIEAARYAVLGGGKRLRPLLALTLASRHDEQVTSVLHAACAIELVHTYSTIHDDLPCMDDDDFRRGKKTLHKVFGQGLALLTGDFLLTYAFEKITQTPHASEHDKLEIIQRLARAGGARGLVGGQYADLTSHQHPQTPEFLHWMHRRKVGSLMRMSVECSALLCRLSPELTGRWALFAQKLGSLIQLAEDLITAIPLTQQPLIVGAGSGLAFASVEEMALEAKRLKERLLELSSDLDPTRHILGEMVLTITNEYEQLPQLSELL